MSRCVREAEFWPVSSSCAVKREEEPREVGRRLEVKAKVGEAGTVSVNLED
ncbi:MAG: hypothetical protein Q8N23_34485 [Archangium sp.]|nr:hypothetical protein [Archangium sp.]MDP3576341.1 hypothetical protein [Archangium sp.]